MRLWRRFRAWWTYTFRCSFWGCEPPDDGSWWVTGRGMVVITPETKNYCGHCGRPV